MSHEHLEVPTEQRWQIEDARAERRLMGRLLALLFAGAVGFIYTWAGLVSAPDSFTIAASAACAVLAVTAWALSRWPAPKLAYMPLVLIGAGIQVAIALHFERADTGFFLLLPSLFTAIFYWRRRVLCTVAMALYVAGFVAPPLVAQGGDAVARVVMTAPIFLMLTLTVGFLGSESQNMQRKKGRFQSTISSLLVALQERDGYTADHSEETVDLAMAVGDELRIDDEQRSVLADVALLHDIGKIGIPNEILNKRSELDDYEWEFMKKHPEIGERIVAPVPGFSPVAQAIRHEHERWDGKGYPDGLAGEEIPLASRIVLVCDAFHAMITDRPYRKSIGLEQARAEMVRYAGSQFDPQVVDALLAVIDGGAIPDSVGRAAWDGVTNGVDAEVAGERGADDDALGVATA